MKVQVKSVHFDADQKLLLFIQERLDKLDHFYEDIIHGEVSLRVENSSDAENKYVPDRLLDLRRAITDLRHPFRKRIDGLNGEGAPITLTRPKQC